MSEESKQSNVENQTKSAYKITSVKQQAVEKSEKAKDPRKVELGKKLAKISKEAKERHKAQREQRKQSEVELERKVDRDDRSLVEEINGYVDFRYIVGGVTIVAALGGLYYTYKSDKRLEWSESERSERSEIETRSSSEPSEEESVKDIEPKALTASRKKVKTNKNEYEITKCKPSTSKSCIENL